MAMPIKESPPSSATYLDRRPRPVSEGRSPVRPKVVKQTPHRTYHHNERSVRPLKPGNWPVPNKFILPFSQIYCHILSTSIMVVMVMVSYIQDISTVIERRFPTFYNLFPQPPERKSPKPPTTSITAEQNRILAHSHVQKFHADLKDPRTAIRRNSRSSSANLTGLKVVTEPVSMEQHEDVLVVDDDRTPLVSSKLDEPPPSFLKRIASYTGKKALGLRLPGRRSVLTSSPTRSNSTGSVVQDYRTPNQNVRYYIEKEGFRCETYHVTTRDGFILQLERILPGPGMDHSIPQSQKPPVILMHGLFQSAGVWVTSRRTSFAFYLADNNYDVWLANNRTCCQEAEKQHVFLKGNESEFWDWSLDELALYDVPAVVEGVKRFTGWEKVAYVGHSQGNAQMFLALKLDPSLNEKLSCFIALAPAVYIGPLLNAFPVNSLINLSSKTHRSVFGVNQFLPIMTIVQKIVPAHVMMTLSYHMFHFLFDWSDTNWDVTNKDHYFQFTPRPQSSKSLHHWAQMGRAKVIQPFLSDAELLEGKAVNEFDVGCIKCPLALYYGTKDAIVDARKLHWQCWESSQRGATEGVVDLVAVEEVEGYEHMDCLWGLNAEEKVWRRVIRVFEGVGWE
ncbi:alpha/beta-hydrolase [Rhizoclosmatium globosum]|uniref:Alpha/beta-hydrolase n=1 Tax=Rhizoclosmatium globosum TaxID=329046 RepID=A0A1Y2B8H5_9FUNG|nr:alpha/beta-hydrolase [Rhizoclosmatium globosum]|eukprot:ORY31151.1 alpha/beta-hydrolase [Rhizoclosmatium globosum]